MRERQVARLEHPHVAQHLRLGVMRVEHRMRQELAAAGEPLVEPVVQRIGQPLGFRSGTAASEYREQRLHVVVGDRLVERHDDPVVAGAPQVDLAPRRRGDDLSGGGRVHPHADRVEVVVALDRVPELLQPRCQQRGAPVNAARNRPQAVRPVPHGVHACDHREQHLCGAHVGRRFFTTDVLLPRLEGHAQRGAPARIAADADDAPGQHALEFVPRRKERRVRSAVAERDAKALGVADADVRAPLARRREQHEAHQVRRNDDERASCVGPGARVAVVEYGTVGGRILEQHTEHVRAEGCGRRIADGRRHPARMGARLHHLDRLRMAPRVDEEGVPRIAPLGLICEEHRLGRSRPLVQQRCVGDLQTRQVDYHRLEVEQRLQPSLCDLGLIGSVGGIPAGILQDVALDHRRRERVVISVSDVRAKDPVLHREGPQRRERLVLARSGVDRQRLPETNRLRNRGVDQRVEGGVAEHGEHGRDVGLAGPHVAWNERVGSRERRGTDSRRHLSLETPVERVGKCIGKCRDLHKAMFGVGRVTDLPTESRFCTGIPGTEVRPVDLPACARRRE